MVLYPWNLQMREIHLLLVVLLMLLLVVVVLLLLSNCLDANIHLIGCLDNCPGRHMCIQFTNLSEFRYSRCIIVICTVVI